MRTLRELGWETAVIPRSLLIRGMHKVLGHSKFSCPGYFYFWRNFLFGLRICRVIGYGTHRLGVWLRVDGWLRVVSTVFVQGRRVEFVPIWPLAYFFPYVPFQLQLCWTSLYVVGVEPDTACLAKAHRLLKSSNMCTFGAQWSSKTHSSQNSPVMPIVFHLNTSKWTKFDRCWRIQVYKVVGSAGHMRFQPSSTSKTYVEWRLC